MLNNLALYAINGDAPEFAALVEGMDRAPFVACTPTQDRTFGWVPPRGEDHAALLEAVGGQWIGALQIEDRTVPGPVIKRALKVEADKIKEVTGRAPKGKALKELKEEVRQSLMPRAFSKLTVIPVWIDPVRNLVGVATTGSTKADMVAMALAECAGTMNLHRLQTAQAADTCMTAWLSDEEAPEGFAFDRDVELRDSEENPAVVSMSNMDPCIEEVRARIENGMRVHKLAMTYRDRVSFTLHGNGSVKGIKVLDVVIADSNTHESAFDADVAIETGELVPLLADLIAALGGAVATPVEDAAKEGDDKAQPENHLDAATDPLFAQAVTVVTSERRASISLVQRHLRIGYNRAARLLERMEKEGLVSAFDAQGARIIVAQGEPA